MNDENANLIAGIGGLRSQIADLSNQNEELEEKVDAIAEAISEAEAIPMEVIESPVDIHVESLVEEGQPIEVLDLNAPAQSVEVIEPTAEPDAEPVAEQAPETIENEAVTEILPIGMVVEEALAGPEKTAEPMAISQAFIPAATADNLQIVEGIGPKIEQLLFKAGINTWRQLAESPVARLREILQAAGSRYSMHDPSTWPEQARIAEEGDWEKLKKWQDELKGGRSEALAQPAQNAQTEPEPETKPASSAR